jgi:hypothetical protein
MLRGGSLGDTLTGRFQGGSYLDSMMRGTRSEAARQLQVWLAGDGAKWQIINFPQVLAAMPKWA